MTTSPDARRTRRPFPGRRTGVPVVLLAAATGVSALLGTVSCGGRSARPNVVLVVVDSLRADAVGGRDGRPSVTPAIDALAAQGLVSERARAQAGWNLPSISSLVTSAYPDRHGQGTSAAGTGDVVTLAEVLGSSGYRTAAFTEAAWPLLERGFGRFSNTAAPHLYGDPRQSSADKTFGEVADWIQAGGQGPFFVLVHTYEVHSYFMGKPYARAAASAEDPGYKGRFLDWGIRDTETPVGPRVIDALLGAQPEDVDYVKGLYRAAVANVDAGVGRLVAALEASGHAKDTVVIVTSSNGEGFRPDLKRVHHGGRLHDDQLRVPLIMTWPGRLRPGSVRSLVESIDVAPTVLALAGLPAEKRFDGSSLVAPETGFMARLRGPRFLASGEAKKESFAEESAMRVLPSGERVASTAHQTALVSDWVKLIEGDGNVELYDLKADPGEERNLAADQPDAVAALRAETERLIAGGSEAGPAAETEDQLRSLGYVQ